MVSSPHHPLTIQREPVEPMETDDLVYPVNPVHLIDVPRDIAIGRNRPPWDRQTLHEAEGHGAPRGTVRERKKPQIFLSCVANMSHIIVS
jgi:hypothetical protein